MNAPNSDEPVIADWPADWPGREVVELDNVGDPGLWIEEWIPSVEEVLFGDPEDDSMTAGTLADQYINAAINLSFPLPTEFGVSEEETRRTVIADFIGFIREWRKRTLAEHEICRSHNRRKSGP